MAQKTSKSATIILANLQGKYIYKFKNNIIESHLTIETQEYQQNIISLTPNIIIKKDKISELNYGQILFLGISIFKITSQYYESSKSKTQQSGFRKDSSGENMS